VSMLPALLSVLAIGHMRTTVDVRRSLVCRCCVQPVSRRSQQMPVGQDYQQLLRTPHTHRAEARHPRRIDRMQQRHHIESSDVDCPLQLQSSPPGFRVQGCTFLLQHSRLHLPAPVMSTVPEQSCQFLLNSSLPHLLFILPLPRPMAPAC
jgi:hypothetical protein